MGTVAGTLVRIVEEYERRVRTPSDIADHLPFLLDQVCRFPGAEVVELGVRTGNSTAAFLAGVHAVEGHLWSVDVAYPRVPDWWQSSGRWTLLVGDDLALVDSLPACDVLFIDTSHHYGQTLAELRAYVPKVRTGGVVLLHDTELERPDGRRLDDPLYPVSRALDTYCRETGRIWTNRTGSYGLGVMEV